MQVALKAIFDSARTTTDGGWKLTFSLDQSQGEQLIQTYALKDKNLFVVIMEEQREAAIVAEDSE